VFLELALLLSPFLRNSLHSLETKGGHIYFIGCQNVDELKATLNSEEQIWEVIAND
jgi:hypothetical protein